MDNSAGVRSVSLQLDQPLDLRWSRSGRALGALGAHHAPPGWRQAMSAAPMDRRWRPRWHPRRCCRTTPTPSWRL